jgi:hypothetical protein
MNAPLAFSDKLRALARGLRERFLPGRRRREPITDRESLRRFLHTRSNYIAQYSLYGYLRTRAGVRFPELFNDDPFVVSINIAKWHIWLDCLSDLAIYAGALLMREGRSPAGEITRLATQAVDGILDEVGTPEEAGPEFAEHAARVRTRIARCDWAAVPADEGAFSESPESLVRWAPVTEELRVLDAEIVKNSIRFRWQEIRRELRGLLDAAAVLSSR